MWKSDKIRSAYLVVNCVGLQTFLNAPRIQTAIGLHISCILTTFNKDDDDDDDDDET